MVTIVHVARLRPVWSTVNLDLNKYKTNVHMNKKAIVTVDYLFTCTQHIPILHKKMITFSIRMSSLNLVYIFECLLHTFFPLHAKEVFSLNKYSSVSALLNCTREFILHKTNLKLDFTKAECSTLRSLYIFLCRT